MRREPRKARSLPRHRLVIVINPRSEVGVSVCISVLIDVGLGREVLWVTTDILLPYRLIHAYIVDLHVRGERQVFEVNETKAFGYSQVDDDILERVVGGRTVQLRGVHTIGSCEIGRAEISTSGSAPKPTPSMVHATLLSDTQEIYWAPDKKWLILFHEGICGRTALSNPGLYSKP